MGVYVLFGGGRRMGLLPLYLRVPCGDSAAGAGRGDAVLQWGIPARDPAEAYVLNPVRNLLRAKHAKSVREIWKLNGLKIAEPSGPPEEWIQEFRVAVFGLDALGVWSRKRSPALVLPAVLTRGSTGGGRGGRTGKPQTSQDAPIPAGFTELPEEEQMTYHVRRAKRDAVRAVYALGLTTGLVSVGIDKAGSTVLLDADPAPAADDRLAELFADAINRYAEERREAESVETDGAGGYGDISYQPSPVRREAGRTAWPGADTAAGRTVLLGADPEFVLRRPDGRFVSASRFLEREGRVGCDAVVLSRSRVIHPLAELRPKPCGEPRELVRELYRTMREAAARIGDTSLAWLSGSMPAKGLPIGGHVHLSGIWLNERLLRVLDNYVALPLVLAEGEAAGQRRPRYGFLGDCRRKRHGGFEYRSLPSWLATPELALSVLTLFRTAALHYRELPARPLDSADVQRAYYRSDKAELLPIARQLWGELEKTAGYRASAKELDAFRDQLFRLEGWDEQADFRVSWQIPPFQSKGAIAPPFVL